MFGPFLAASCVALGHAASNMIAWENRKRPKRKLPIAAGVTLLISTFVVVVCMIRQQIWDTLALLVVCGIAVVLVTGITRLLPSLPPPDAPLRWLRIRAASSIVAALLMFTVQLFGIGLIWRPL